ncbi:MAG: hypothetical protein U9N50_04970, partial [Pseudomonadota bacterium]|nr:hypothetical protein [Pseudomonadota bacterium]
MVRKFLESYGIVIICLFAAVALISTGEAFSSDEPLSILEAKYNAGDHELKVKGKRAGKGGTVKIYNAATGTLLDTVTADKEGKWKSISSPSPVPCKVKAVSHGSDDKKDVEDAPENCDGGQGGTNQPPVTNDDTASTLQDTNVI